MLWTRIEMAPCPDAAPVLSCRGDSFVARLPLHDDGSIAFKQLRKGDLRAEVVRMEADGQKVVGRISFVDGQWGFTWRGPNGELNVTRFHGARFRQGDHVCLMHESGPLRLYHVSSVEEMPSIH